VSAPDAPSDVYLVDTATGAAGPVRKEPRPVLDRLPPITASIALVTSFDGLKVPVNVYLPALPTPGQRMGTYVWFHGGPDASSPLEWDAWYRVLIANGYAVLEPNIRGSTGFGRAFARGDDREKRWDALRDVAAVNTWARSQPWCDPARMVISGGSFGGYVTLMALENQPTLWRAGVDLAGPSDLVSLIDGHTPMRYIEEIGDPVKDRALLASLSPIHAVDKIRAPLFVYQGANDQHVRRDQADSIVHALRDRGIPVEYMVPTDEGHTVARRANEVELYTRVLRFLGDQLAPR
jgi:dipeptidyl aminopeptidase/acylaminoacyl peptidase